MITEDRVIEFFRVMDDFVKNLHTELQKNLMLEVPEDGTKHRNRKGRLSESEIMTILVCYRFGSSGNFKHYYMLYVRGHLGSCFPDAVSHDRFVGLMPRVFFHMMPSMKLRTFGKCPGISFVDSTMIPVRHNPGGASTRCSRTSLRTAGARGDGVTASSSTSCATVAERS